MHDNESELLSKTMVVVLANDQASQLGESTCEDCKADLPFGSVFKPIDLTLSNCLNSHLTQVGVALQHQSASLLSHLQRSWTPLREHQQFTVTPWEAQGKGSSTEYLDTVDAVLKNWTRIAQQQPRWIMVLTGDHICKIDLRRVLSFHIKKEADVTLGCVELPLAEASRYGVVRVEEGYRVSEITQKPATPSATPYRRDRAFASMGIYVFNTDVLSDQIGFDSGQVESTDDFGRDIIPKMVTSKNVFAYPFSSNDPIGGGYWRDVKTLNDYWSANMELLGTSPHFSLNDSVWPLQGCASHSAYNWVGKHYLADATKISDSLIAADCKISSSTISHTVVSPNVHIGYCSSIHETIIHPNASIGRSCRLHGVIVPSDCHIPDGMQLLNPQLENNRLKPDWSPIVVTEKHCRYLSFGVNSVAHPSSEMTKTF